MKTLTVLLLAAAVGAVAQAFAQGRAGTSQCGAAPPSFPLTAANRVAWPALDALFRGKIAEALRSVDAATHPRNRARERVMTWDWRADGSFRVRCESRTIGSQRSGEFHPCAGFGPEGKGGEDVGVWRVDKDRLCIKRTRSNRPESDNCFLIHGQDGRYYAKYEGGARRSCLEGEIVFR